MNKLLRLRDGSSLDVLGLITLGVILLSLTGAIMLIAPTVALYRNPPVRVSTLRDDDKAFRRHQEALEKQVAMINGRSLFFEPRPPEYVPDTGPKPVEYGGPSLIAYINGTAWFSDGQKVSAKEPESTSLKWVSGNPPWSVRVNWKGVEFDVKLFERTEIASLRSSVNSPTRTSFWGTTPQLTAPPPAAPSAGGPPPDPPGALSGRMPSDALGSTYGERLGPGPGPDSPGQQPAEPNSGGGPPPGPPPAAPPAEPPADPGAPPATPPPSEPTPPASDTPREPPPTPPERSQSTPS